MTSFIRHSSEFDDVVGDAPRLVKVVETDAHEGPVYVADQDALYFTSRPVPTEVPVPGTRRVAVKRLALAGDRFPVDRSRVSIIREPANNANGMTLDREGRLVICEQGTTLEAARISRMDLVSHRIEAAVEQWGDLPFNSPNDVVVKRDGTVWFTDPSYGFLQGFKPAPLLGDYVYRYDPRTDRISVVEDSFNKPNGLAFSPDESVLYITDSGANQAEGSFHVNLPHHIRAFDVRDGRHLVNGRLFAVTTPGFPDGVKVDAVGHVYASAQDGVQIFNPSGDLIGEIRLPGAVNFTFGGPGGNVLFITADTAVWAAVLRATGPGRLFTTTRGERVWR